MAMLVITRGYIQLKFSWDPHVGESPVVTVERLAESSPSLQCSRSEASKLKMWLQNQTWLVGKSPKWRVLDGFSGKKSI